jgi:hypothetical protein
MLNLVISFSGETTLPEFLMMELVELIKNVTVNTVMDMWELLWLTLKHGERFLNHSALIVIFQDDTGIHCIEFRLHEPPHQNLGVTMWRGNPAGECHPGPSDLTYNNSHTSTPKEAIKQRCCRCGFVSGWIQ